MAHTAPYDKEKIKTTQDTLTRLGPYVSFFFFTFLLQYTNGLYIEREIKGDDTYSAYDKVKEKKDGPRHFDVSWVICKFFFIFLF